MQKWEEVRKNEMLRVRTAKEVREKRTKLRTVENGTEKNTKKKKGKQKEEDKKKNEDPQTKVH